MQLYFHSSWLEICVHVKVYSMVWCYSKQSAYSSKQLNVLFFVDETDEIRIGLCVSIIILSLLKLLPILWKLSFNVSLTTISRGTREDRKITPIVNIFWQIVSFTNLVHQDVVYISLYWTIFPSQHLGTRLHETSKFWKQRKYRVLTALYHINHVITGDALCMLGNAEHFLSQKHMRRHSSSKKFVLKKYRSSYL